MEKQLVTASFWIILAALGVYGVFHSLIASLGAKRFARRIFGSAVDRYYRLVFSMLGGITFLPVLALSAWLPDQVLYRLPFPWAILFILLQALGLIFFVWSLAVTDLWAFLGLRQLATASTDVEHLTLDGPYRLVRHPMYTSTLMVLWFTPLMTVNLLALNLGVTAYFILGGVFEERKLLRQFGQVYADYRQRTPMLLPCPRRGKSSGA
jgi:protein-S-isoprenylcysteine O-methyltransferase Ste14